MTAKRTGTLEPCKDASGRPYWRGKVRLEDGSRSRVEVPEPKCYSETASRDFVAWAQEEEDTTRAIYLGKRAKAERIERATAGAAGESCDKWFDRFHLYGRELGQTDAGKKRTRWSKWVSPKIGPKPMALVTRDDIEDIRDALDGAIGAHAREGAGAGRITGKTAMNAWSALTSAFKAATSSKRRDLRVLDGKPNPCVGVEPPGDRDSRKPRRKTFLYPREAAALFACEAVPLEWREVYAIALHTYVRPGELRVLTWEDVDLAAGHIRVTKAWDYSDEKVKAPKTRNGVRTVPIDASLMPLLERMRKGAEPTALVARHLHVFGEDHLAEVFRKHLQLAGCTRIELHRTTRTHVQSNFRSCRDSGLTWLALSGLGVDKIMRRAGHDNVQTSMGYVKQAEDLTGDLGAPFGALPGSLVAGRPVADSSNDRATHRATLDPDPPSDGVFQWAQRDLNPRLQPCEGRTLPLSYAPEAVTGRAVPQPSGAFKGPISSSAAASRPSRAYRRALRLRGLRYWLPRRRNSRSRWPSGCPRRRA